jgi:serine protease Do
VAILPQLKTIGRVSRGYMGVFLTDVTPALQRSLSLPVDTGALVQDLQSGSPAERAGLQAYDVIVGLDGDPIHGNDQLIRTVSSRQPGTVARLDVVRQARRLTVPVKLAERPLDSAADPDPLSGLGTAPRRPDPAATTPLGVSVRALDRGGRVRLPDFITDGVTIARVDGTGTAYGLLQRGMVVLEINREPVRSIADYNRIVAAARPGTALAFYVYDPENEQRVLIAVPVE